MSTTNIHIMRTAAELWELAGPNMWLYELDEDGHALLQASAYDPITGTRPRCKMTPQEFVKYQAVRNKWQAAGQDLAAAPVISMLVVSLEEEMELAALRLRPSSDFARSFREIEECLLAHARCLSDDERDEIIRQIAAKIMPLKEAVLRAEEIWLEDHQTVGVTVNGHQLSRLDEIIEPDTNEELHLTNNGACLVATIKVEDHEAEWVLTKAGKFGWEGGAV